MEQSILKTTKKIIGVGIGDTSFDLDIILHINATFSVLSQLGVGPDGGFSIEDDTATWADYVVDSDQLHLVKTYMGLNVKFLFDPPTTSFAITAMEKQLEQYEWRLNIFREYDLHQNG